MKNFYYFFALFVIREVLEFLIFMESMGPATYIHAVIKILALGSVALSRVLQIYKGYSMNQVLASYPMNLGKASAYKA